MDNTKHNDDIDAFLNIRQVMELVTFSASHIYRQMRQGRFPNSIKIGISRVAWRKSDIQKYLNDPFGWGDTEAF